LTKPALACPVLDTGYLIRGNPVFSLWARFHPRGGSTPEGGPSGPEAIWIPSGPEALWAGGPLEFTPGFPFSRE